MTDFEKQIEEAAQGEFESESLREGFRFGARYAQAYAEAELASLMGMIKLWEQRNAENTAEIERLSQLYRNKSDQVIRFSNENARLREALAFYADPTNYRTDPDDQKEQTVLCDDNERVDAFWNYVGGKRARDALGFEVRTNVNEAEGGE
jgi:hypothetical protein